jgi:protein-tyrosine phosphatase
VKFFNRSSAEPSYDFSKIARDIHSHILPGLDDGSPDVETSIQLLKALSSVGINTFICTPHIIGDMYRNTPETITGALQVLKRACLENNLAIHLSAAAEYMLDDYFMALLKKREPLLTLTGNYILTELSYSTAPDNLEKIAFEININNYLPLLAHPERYSYYHKNYDAFFRLKELGFMLQVNLLSLTGYYGASVAKAANFIFKNDLVDFVGTDLHHFNHLNALTDKHNHEIFHRVLGDKIYNSFDIR